MNGGKINKTVEVRMRCEVRFHDHLIITKVAPKPYSRNEAS